MYPEKVPARSLYILRVRFILMCDCSEHACLMLLKRFYHSDFARRIFRRHIEPVLAGLLKAARYPGQTGSKSNAQPISRY